MIGTVLSSDDAWNEENHNFAIEHTFARIARCLKVSYNRFYTLMHSYKGNNKTRKARGRICSDSAMHSYQKIKSKYVDSLYQSYVGL